MLYTLCRPLLRTAVLRTTTGNWALRQPTAFKLARPVPKIITGPMLTRFVASSVSGKPGSQTLEHAAENIKEELGNSAADLAKVIAASNVTQNPVDSKGAESFVCGFPSCKFKYNRLYCSLGSLEIFGMRCLRL